MFCPNRGLIFRDFTKSLFVHQIWLKIFVEVYKICESLNRIGSVAFLLAVPHTDGLFSNKLLRLCKTLFLLKTQHRCVFNHDKTCSICLHSVGWKVKIADQTLIGWTDDGPQAPTYRSALLLICSIALTEKGDENSVLQTERVWLIIQNNMLRVH